MTPGFYLATLKENGRIDPYNLDGPHSKIEGVAKARYSYRALGLNDHTGSFVMIEVLPVPDESNEGVDKDAVEFMSGIVLSYNEEKPANG